MYSKSLKKQKKMLAVKWTCATCSEVDNAPINKLLQTDNYQIHLPPD